MSSSTGIKVVFLALGTIGDARPLVFVACHLALQLKNLANEVIFVTYESTWDDVLSSFCTPSGVDLIHFKPVQGSAMVMPHDAKNQLSSEVTECLKICENSNFIVFNLFALFGYHIAEKLGISCACLSPSFPQQKCPARFVTEFMKEYQEMYAELCRIDAHISSSDETLTSWGFSDIQHWLWRIFIENDHGVIRESLDLPSSPLCSLDDCRLKLLPRLLYGISPIVCQDMCTILPKRVSMCGYWRAESDTNPQPWLTTLMQMKEMKSENHQLIYVGFGSMSQWGEIAIENLNILAETVQNAISQCKGTSIFVCHGSQVLHDVWCQNSKVLDSLTETFSPEDSQVSNILIFGSLPHNNFLRHCDCVIHHGGAGTFAECLESRVPQIIVPFCYDQHYWGDQATSLGVGLKCNPLLLRSGDTSELVHYLTHIDELRPKIEKISTLVDTENGVNVACDILMDEMHSCQKMD